MKRTSAINITCAKRNWLVGLLILCFVVTVGCGGGVNVTSTSAPGPTPGPSVQPSPSPSVAVSINPTSVTVPAGSSQQFSVHVANSTNTAVTWKVNGIPGGNPQVGTISRTGVYYAPLAPPAVGNVTISAVAQADVTKSASVSVTPVFSNASLVGPFVFESIVSNDFGYTLRGGVFVSDGAGNLSNGIEDYNDSYLMVNTGMTFSGTYTVGPDGRGTATLNSSDESLMFRFVLVSQTTGRLVEFDNGPVTSGFLQAQNLNTSKNASGTYVYGFQGQDNITGGPASTVGQIQFDGSGNISGIQDRNDYGNFSDSVPFTGTYSLGDQGRGTASMTSASATSSFVFYVVDQKTIVFLNVDYDGLLVAGSAVAQDAITFDNSSLGSTTFVLSGADSTFKPMVAAGRFDTDAAGNIQNGVQDKNGGGTFSGYLPFSGTYSVAANGRGTASITDINGTTSFVFWLSSSGNAQWMESDNMAVISGTARSQQGGPFGASTLKGNYAFTVAGISGYVAVAGVGAVTANGSGNLAGTQDFNSHWSATTDTPLSGAYSIASNGVGAAALTASGALPLHVLMISPSEGVLVSIDPTQPVIGMTEQQCSDCH